MVALEIKILETFPVFIKNLNFQFSPKFDSTIVAFGGDVQRTEGAFTSLPQTSYPA